MMNTILLVEDNDHVMKINRETLELYEYRVVCAASIRQAKEKLQEEMPDLIVLDVMLPDGSGLDLCRKIRKLSTVPILLLTCLDDSNQIVAGLEAGGDDYLTKPYRLKEFTARIKALLRRVETPSQDRSLHFGSVSIDPIAQMILYKDKPPVQLSQKEFGLLVVLLDHRDKYVSEKTLYQQVWGSSDESDKNTVRVNISRLRKKLNTEEDAQIQIAYVPDRGYKLSVLTGELL